MDAWLDTLLNPPFAKDPPVKLNIPAKTLGAVYAIVGAISALFGVLGLLGLGGYLAYVSVGGLGFLIVSGALINLIGTILAAWGGYRMYQEDRDGKRLATYGLALTALGGLVTVLGTLGGGILSLVITFVLYYLVIICRFEGEPKLV